MPSCSCAWSQSWIVVSNFRQRSPILKTSIPFHLYCPIFDYKTRFQTLVFRFRLWIRFQKLMQEFRRYCLTLRTSVRFQTHASIRFQTVSDTVDQSPILNNRLLRHNEIKAQFYLFCVCSSAPSDSFELRPYSKTTNKG